MPCKPCSPDITIESDLVRLRLLAQSDLPKTLMWRNQETVRAWFFNSDPIKEADHVKWFAGYLEKPDDLVFIIEQKPSLCPVGQVSLYHIDMNFRRCEYGRLMIGDSQALGRGFAKAATDLVLAFAASTLKLTEVYLEVYAKNTRAIGLYLKCGFNVEKTEGESLRMTWRPS